MNAPLENQIRNAVRALIRRDDCILLLRKQDELKGERYALPGGAQEAGETLHQALSRECQEEIGTDVVIHELIHVADWFKLRSMQPPVTRHLVEFLFCCDIPADYLPHNGHHPDKHQIEVVWIPLSQLTEIQLLPASMIPYLAEAKSDTTYLGTLN